MGANDEPDLTLIQPLSEASGLCGGPGQLTCGEANELIQLYLDKVADQDEGAKVAEHLDGCPPCESELVVYQRIIASLERCRPPVPQDTAERLQRFCTELRSGAHDLHGE
jgi:hypothetical protein